MRVEQAIYTSLPRDGRAGYHVVSRSPGLTDDEARAYSVFRNDGMNPDEAAFAVKHV